MAADTAELNFMLRLAAFVCILSSELCEQMVLEYGESVAKWLVVTLASTPRNTPVINNMFAYNIRRHAARVRSDSPALVIDDAITQRQHN